MILPDKKFIRAIRLLIALAAGIITGHLLDIPRSGWITVTTAVILFDQSTVGGTISRSSLRLIGTLTAAIICLLCLILFHNNHIMVWLILAISSFTYAYLFMDTKKSYIGVLGIATLSILLVGSNDSGLHTAIYRLMDILIGIIFALLSMLIIFPEYALAKSRGLIFVAIKDIHNLIDSIKNQKDSVKSREQILQVENKFVNDIVAFNKTIDEASYEWKSKRKPHLIDNYKKAFLQIRRLYRLLIVAFFYELDYNKLDDSYVNNIFRLILNILDSIIKNESQQINLNHAIFEELKRLMNELEDPALRRISNNFINELFTLNQLLTVH